MSDNNIKMSPKVAAFFGIAAMFGVGMSTWDPKKDYTRDPDKDDLDTLLQAENKRNRKRLRRLDKK